MSSLDSNRKKIITNLEASSSALPTLKRGHVALPASGANVDRQYSRKQTKFRDLFDPNCQLVDVAELFHDQVQDRSPGVSAFWNVKTINRLGEVLKSLNYNESSVGGNNIKRKHVNGKHVSMLLYGLRGNAFKGNPTELTQVLEHINRFILSPLVNREASLGQPLTTRQVVLMLFSFQHIKIGAPSGTGGASPQCLEFLRLLLRLIDGGYTATISGKGELSAHNISNILCNLQNFSSDVPEVRQVLLFLTSFIQTNLTATVRSEGSSPSSSTVSSLRPVMPVVLAPQHIGNCLYGLRELSSNSPEVVGLLQMLVTENVVNYDVYVSRQQHESNSNSVPQSMTVKEISNALYGLQGLRFSDSTVSGAVVSFVDRCIPYLETFSIAKDEVTSQAIGNSLYGIRRLLEASSSDFTSARAVVARKATMNKLYNLLSKLIDCAASSSSLSQLRPLCMTAQNVSSAVYGLSNIECRSSEASPEIRRLLDVLAARIAVPHTLSLSRLDCQFSPFQVSNAVYGMRNMSSAVPEVQLLLEALLSRFQAANAVSSGASLVTEALDERHLSVALYGLRHMAATHAGVSPMLEYLLARYTSATAKQRAGAEVDFQSISNCLIGIQNLSCEVPVAREIMQSAVIPQLQRLSLANSGALPLPRITPNRASQIASNVLYSLHEKEDRDSVVVNTLALICHSLVPTLVKASRQPALGGTDFGTDTGLFRSIQAIASGLYGLQRCSSDYFEGRELAHLLSEHIQRFSSGYDTTITAVEIEPQHVAMILYGCRYFHNSHVESQELLKSILPLLSLPLRAKEGSSRGKDRTGVLTSYQLCRCFYGIQNLTYLPMNKEANATTFALLQLLLNWFQQVNAFSVDEDGCGSGGSGGAINPDLTAASVADTDDDVLDYMDAELEEHEFFDLPTDWKEATTAKRGQSSLGQKQGRGRRDRGDGYTLSDVVKTHNSVEDIQKAMGIGLFNLRSSLEDGFDTDTGIETGYGARANSNGSITVSVAGNRNLFLAQERKERHRLSEVVRQLQKELVLYAAYRE